MSVVLTIIIIINIRVSDYIKIINSIIIIMTNCAPQDPVVTIVGQGFHRNRYCEKYFGQKILGRCPSSPKNGKRPNVKAHEKYVLTAIVCSNVV
jgi:hypothetical protein